MKDNSSAYIFWSQKYLLEGLNLFRPNRTLIWHHPNLAKTTNKMFLWTYDPIFYIKKGNPTFTAHFCNKENVDVFVYSKPQNNWKGDNKRFHPTSKPPKLIQNFIKISSCENDIILDPFLGGGTTAIACKRLNRNFITIEKDTNYYNISLERFKNETFNDLYEE
jgi:DNA modification methylase